MTDPGAPALSPSSRERIYRRNFILWLGQDHAPSAHLRNPGRVRVSSHEAADLSQEGRS